MKLELKHLTIAFTNNWKVTYFDDERELNQVCNIVELREDECIYFLIFYYLTIVTGKQIGRASCRERVSSPV